MTKGARDDKEVLVVPLLSAHFALKFSESLFSYRFKLITPEIFKTFIILKRITATIQLTFLCYYYHYLITYIHGA